MEEKYALFCNGADKSLLTHFSSLRESKNRKGDEVDSETGKGTGHLSESTIMHLSGMDA